MPMNPIYPSVRKLLLTAFFALSLQFVFSQPVISSFSPAAGPAGLQVVIKGSNFSATAASNIVRFGVVQAQVLSAAADSLLVRVPVSANYQELTVTTGGLTGYYNPRPPFIETFGTGGVAFSGVSFAGPVNAVMDGPSLTVMDVNGDGKPDLISGVEVAGGIVQGGRSSFSVVGNTGDSGTVAFAAAQYFPAANAPFFTCSADMNGDGKPDVVAWDTALGVTQIAVFLNNGSGSTISFDGGTKYPFPESYTVPPNKIIVRDLDGDGKPDVLTYHSTFSGDTSYLSLLQNTGTGGSVSLVQLPDLIAVTAYAGTPSISDFIVEDFNHDGKPDIVTEQQNGFYFYLNTSVPGTISFSAGVQLEYLPPGTVLTGLTAGDMDGDGFPELIYVRPATNQLFVAWNNGQSGVPAFYEAHTYATGNSPQRLAIGDLDGDGKPDLAVSNFQDGTVSVYRNTCTGGANNLSFDPQVTYSTGPAVPAVNSPNELSIVDIDGDHRPDILVANGGTVGLLAVLRNLMPYAGPPRITAFTPTTATAGTKVGITGINFTGTLGISFGGDRKSVV